MNLWTTWTPCVTPQLWSGHLVILAQTLLLAFTVLRVETPPPATALDHYPLRKMHTQIPLILAGTRYMWMLFLSLVQLFF